MNFNYLAVNVGSNKEQDISKTCKALCETIKRLIGKKTNVEVLSCNGYPGPITQIYECQVLIGTSQNHTNWVTTDL